MIWYIYLDGNRLKTLHPGLFLAQTALLRLRIENNRFKCLDPAAFYPLKNLQTLGIDSTYMDAIHKDMFVLKENKKGYATYYSKGVNPQKKPQEKDPQWSAALILPTFS